MYYNYRYSYKLHIININAIILKLLLFISKLDLAAWVRP